MENKGDIIVIGTAPFIIDAENRALKQFNKPGNIFSYNDLKDEGGYYSIQFDTNRNKIVLDLLEFGKHYDHIINVVIPSAVIDAPDSLSEDFKLDLNISSQKESWGFFIGDENLAMRLSGKLPHIDLAGTDFTIDWRLKELRETELPWKHISLRDMEMSDSGEEYLCFYNVKTHELFEPDENLLELPENVVVLEIPYEIKLDPVAVAREYGIGEIDLLTDHPFQMKLAAKVTPLLETGLPDFIKQNLENRSNQQDNDEPGPKRGR
jgi:hypothetical protein